MKQNKFIIFISGNQKELRKERITVKSVILENVLFKEHFDIFLFEDSPAQSKSSSKVYLNGVNKCDIYIGILGDKYGDKISGGISATEKEFRAAKDKNKDILIYIKGKDDSKRDESLKKLINEIKKPEAGYKYKRFKDVSKLKTCVFESLIVFLQEKGIVGKLAFDMSICEGASYKDIDEEKVRWFLSTARARRNYPVKETAPLKDVFTHLNLLKDGKLTNAAVLLFGKDPHRYHLQAETKCLQFSGTEVEKPFLSYHIYNGNLFDQIDRATAFVLSSIRLPVIQQEHTVQVKRPPEIPLFAVQEGIVNAVAHRDYNNNAGVQVMVFIDRVEIWNPGSLPSYISVTDLKKPHHSCPRNPLLAEVLYLADYIQKAGSGTIEMTKQCKECGLPEPEFINRQGYEFRAILGRDVLTERVLMKLGLNERQLKAVKHVKEKGKITNKEYQEINSISRQTASRELAVLDKKGMLLRRGKTGRDAHYILASNKRLINASNAS